MVYQIWMIPAMMKRYISLLICLKCFGDPTRIRILAILSKQELCVQDIADSLSMTQSAISHQLRILKQSALVKFRRDGKTIYYSLADDHVATIMAQGLEHVCE